jgi:hypothetical protein
MNYLVSVINDNTGLATPTEMAAIPEADYLTCLRDQFGVGDRVDLEPSAGTRCA